MPQIAPQLFWSVAALALVGCVRVTAARAPGTTVSPPAAEAAVYAAAVARLYPGALPDTVYAAESTFVFRVPAGAVAEWRRQYDAIPAALTGRLAAVSARRVPTGVLPLPRPVRVVRDGELAALYGRAGARWAGFHRRFPRAARYVALSPAALSADGTEAAVYYEYHCGDTCGGGELAWLARGADGAWGVRRVVTFWVS